MVSQGGSHYYGVVWAGIRREGVQHAYVWEKKFPGRGKDSEVKAFLAWLRISEEAEAGKAGDEWDHSGPLTSVLWGRSKYIKDVGFCLNELEANAKFGQKSHMN